MSLREVWLCWRRRRTLTYPVRTSAGPRRERAVMWLCKDCEKRAVRRRSEEAAGASLELEPAPAPPGACVT
jgi:hypothetical protein